MPFSSADPNAYLAIGMQSGLGSPQTTPSKFRFVKFLSGTDFDPVIEAVDLREGGDGLDFGFTYKKSEKVAGQIVAYARPEVAGQLLSILPGGATWDGASAPAIHDFHTGHASHPWATLQIAHPGTSMIQLLSDVRFSGLKLEIAGGEPWKLTFPFVGINAGASTNIALVPSYSPVEDPFMGHMNPTYVLDGSGDSDITAVTFDLGLSLEELQSQAITLDEIVVQARSVDVEITRRYEANTQFKKIYYNSGVTPTTAIATGAIRVDSSNALTGANLRQAQVEARLLSYRAGRLTEMDPDGKTAIETMSAKALKGATHALRLQLQNGHASAYAS